MPRSRPPQRALHGQLEARPSHRAHESRELPIRVAESTAAERGSSPVAGLIKHAAAIKAVDEEPVVILRALDGGRLFARSLVEEAAWPPSIELVAELLEDRRIRLRAQDHTAGSVKGTLTPHVDDAGRICVSVGLRKYLGVSKDSPVLAYSVAPGVIEIIPAAVVPGLLSGAEIEVPARTVRPWTHSSASNEGGHS